MEANQNTENSVSNESNLQSQRNSDVSFPTVDSPKKSNGAKTLLIIGVLVLAAILGFVIYKSAGKKEADVSSTPTTYDNLTTPSSAQTLQTYTPAPSASPSASIDKSKIEVQVLNGTGISGEAAYLQTQLGTLGYTNIKLGNSSATVTATSVTFLSTLDSSVVSEITQKLNSIYQNVNTQTSTSPSFDVVITTGLRKGMTPKPVATTAPQASSTPSATPTASP